MTAYVLRISDLVSDVGASDLGCPGGGTRSSASLGMEWGRSSVPAKRGCLLHCRTGRGAARLAGFGCCGPWLPRCCHSRFRGNDDPVPSRSVPSDVFPSDPPMTDPRLDDLRRNIPRSEEHTSALQSLMRISSA